jgi:xylulokinase
VILGLDLGTQGLKALLLDAALAVRGKAFEPYPTRYPQQGSAEQDPLDWERALGIAVGRALASAGQPPSAVRAIGITGQLDGCVAVGEGGTALTPCLIWMDRRASLTVGREALAKIRRLGGVNPDPGHMAAKIRWLLDRDRGSGHAVCFHQPVSYLVERLTGSRVFDHGLASTTMLYGLERGGFEPELLAAFGIDPESLPRIAGAEQPAGSLSATGSALAGLPAGVPVAVGTGDDFASPLGAGLVEPGSVACVLGTAEVVGALSRSARVDPVGLVETHCYPGGLYFVENPGWLSGGALGWFVQAFSIGDVRELERRAAMAPAGAEGVLFLPALSGAMAPEWIPAARGCFYGLSAAHGSAHLARAVLEGCAFAMRDVLERLQALALPAERIYLMGGGAASSLWAGIRASVSGMTVRRCLDGDTAPVGAAMLAGVAAGLYPDLGACAARLPGSFEEIAPEPAAAAAYERAYGRYRRLFDSLRPMFDREEGA